MRLKLLAAVSALALLPLSLAQAAGPSEVVVSTPAVGTTYSAAATLAPAASATDFLTIVGSATKTIYLKRVYCTGTSTAAGSAVVSLVKRSTADTAGTSTAPTMVPNDSGDVAATAAVAAYTANPTVGTAVGTLRTGLLTTVVLASAGAAPLDWVFGNLNDKAPTLRGVAQVLALNAVGASFTAGASLSCSVEWTEQ